MKTAFAALAALATLLQTACTTPTPVSTQDAFWARLSALCGRAFAGQVASTDAADEAFRNQPLIMHVRTCAPDEIRIPFHVGENRSRTWVISRTPDGLRLKHDHRHEDGAEDALTQYGGDTAGAGDAQRQEFPADEFSKQLFRSNDIPASAGNVWALEVQPGRLFAYELRRANRHFRVEFDLTQPAAEPLAPWGGN